MFTQKPSFLSLASLAGLVWCIAATASGQLHVGAARVDITPDPAMMPPPFASIHDHVFTRAIFIENGNASALIMNVAVGKFTQEFYDKLSKEISSRYDIPLDNLVISAVHVHSNVPDLGAPIPGSKAGPLPASKAYVERVYQGMIQAAGQAKASSQPAEIGFGEGQLFLNVNRDAIDPKTRQWSQEPNFAYPSDKTLAVVEFRRPSGGEPIAIYMNYAMHANTMFLRGQISGDFPEVASRYLEDNFDDKVVAVWSSGAAGDQNPIYRRAINAIDEAQIKNEMDPSRADEKGGFESVAAMMRLMFGGAERPAAPLDPKLETQSWQIVQSIGQLMAEETLRVMDGISHFRSAPAIEGSSKSITCPGRKRLDHAREGVSGNYEDGPPTHIDVGTLRIGDIAIGRVNGEIYNKIGQEAKSGSPFQKTIVVTLANGEADTDYIPSDDAFGRSTFEVLGSHLLPGCAEMGIVNGIDGLLNQDMGGSNLN